MNTTIELETMLENKHGKLLANKDWHIFTIEAEDPEAFLRSIHEKLDILHERMGDNAKAASEDTKKEFIQYYSAMMMTQTGDLIVKHSHRWDPIIATITKEADNQDIPDDPMIRAIFGMEFLSKVMRHEEE